MAESSGFKSHFRYWIASGSLVQVAGGDRDLFVLLNEGGPQIRIGNVTGTPLATLGMLIPSGTMFNDAYSDDDWWAFNLGAGSGSVSGYVVRSNL